MIFTPAQSLKHFKAINKATGLSFQDSTWKNDETDSIEHLLPNGRTLKVMLPCARRGYPRFTVDHSDYENESETTYLSHEGREDLTLNEVISVIKEYLKTL
jgi:hypothetical protein